MKKVLIFILTLVLGFSLLGCGEQDNNTYISIFSRPTTERVAGQRKEWNDVSSFVCYYSDFDIDFQSQFDVIIMHSTTLYSDPESKEKVKQLQDLGCYIISYVTIGEDDALHVADGLGEGGYASYYIYENGRPKMNTNWNSYFVDAGNPVWQARVIAETEKALSYGVDGIFMDTLDTVDVEGSSLEGMTDLVRRLDETFPEAKFVANRGFTVLPYISQYIDGLMFESFNTTYDFERDRVTDLSEESIAWNEDIACNTINNIRRYDYFPVFALDYVNKFEYDYFTINYYNRSWQFDFIPYCTYDIQLKTPAIPTDAEGKLLAPTSKRGELALSKLASDTLDNFNGDMSSDNLAFKDNGAVITVSSSFGGYNQKALNDGWFVTKQNHVQSNWAKESWASSDNKGVDHYIQIAFPEAKEVSQVVVHWANDNDKFYSPRKAIIQVLIDEHWVDVCTLTNEPEEEDGDYKTNETTWIFDFDPQTTTAVRIVQPKGCGAHNKFNDPIRAGIMWVSEVEVYKEAKQ